MPLTMPPVQSTVLTNPGFAGSPGLAARRGSGGSLSRSQILQATGACFAESGYDGTTIRAIAARLGCSVGSIYRYFHDKRDLLLACGAQLVTPILEPLESGQTTLDASLRLYLEQAMGHDQLYRLLFWLTAGEGGGDAPGPGAGAGMPEPIRRVIDGWADLLGDRDRAEQCWAALHGMLMLGREPEQILWGVAEWTASDKSAERERRFAMPYAAQAKEDMTLL